MPDEALALELDRALAGADATEEARELAALLTAAADPARFDVADAELERRLAAAQPRPRSRRRLAPVIALAGAAAAVALVLTLVRTPGNDVEAHAAQALDAAFFVVEQTRAAQPGLFRTTATSGYVDGRRGRAHLRVTSGGEPVSETVVDGDRVERYVAASNTLYVASSCSAFPDGCAEALDPLSLYVRTLESGKAHTRRVGGVYRLMFAGKHVDQIVTIDAHTYLPRRIEWRDDGRLVSVTRFIRLERQSVAPTPDAYVMSQHDGARVVQLTSTGGPVRIVSVRATMPSRGLIWLGPRYEGFPARVAEVRFTQGKAVRVTYGPYVVWDFDRVVPPDVLAGRAGPAKTFALANGGLAHVYFGPGYAVVAEADLSSGRAAVVSRAGGKADVVRAVQQLRTLGAKR